MIVLHVIVKNVTTVYDTQQDLKKTNKTTYQKHSFEIGQKFFSALHFLLGDSLNFLNLYFFLFLNINFL